MTKIVNNETTKRRLCETCAREFALDAGLNDAAGMPLDEIIHSLFQSTDFNGEHPSEIDEEDVERVLEEAENALEDAEGVLEAFEGEFPPAWALQLGEFPADEDMVDEMEDSSDEEIPDLLYEAEASPAADESLAAQFFQAINNPARERVPTVRCPKCSTTWDRLKQDGRAGCPQCYKVFAEQLQEVMQRVQRAPQHAGKHPRAAEKRRRRLEHLRARRDHRLDMLNRRLKESVAAERYEEAAKLRDKIKIITSTIVSHE